MSTLKSHQFQRVVTELHTAARSQQRRRWGLGTGIVGRIKKATKPTPSMEQLAVAGEHAYLSVSDMQGELLYLLLRLIQARNVVEYGTSFGVSTLYLAAAVQDNGGGLVIGSELLATKAQRARQNIEAAGLTQCVEIRTGDAQQTLQSLPEVVDALFLDGHKPMYSEIFTMVEPRLRPGAVVVADNIFNFSDLLRPYMQKLRDTELFWTIRCPIGGGMAISVRR